MWVWLAINGDSGPSVLDDLDVGGVDVLVSLDKMCAEDRGEQFWWVDRVLLCLDVDGVLHRIGRNNDAVIGSRVRGLDFTLKQDSDCHLSDSVGFGCFIPVDFVYTDIVLSISAGGDFRHVGGIEVVVYVVYF